MVKVLENKVIDLDLLPGQAQIDLQRQFRTQIQNAQGQAQVTAGQIAEVAQNQGGAALKEGQNATGEAGGLKPGQVQIPREMLPDSMSEEQKDQARGIAGTIVDGSGNVLGGLAGTVGGVLKGVGDTGANVVSFFDVFVMSIMRVCHIPNARGGDRFLVIFTRRLSCLNICLRNPVGQDIGQTSRDSRFDDCI
jgi:hypothetical protein